MEMQYFKDYSPALGRDMECKIYGHAGRPMLYVPCQDGRFFDFEDFHMADTLAPWIESGQIMVLFPLNLSCTGTPPLCRAALCLESV